MPPVIIRDPAYNMPTWAQLCLTPKEGFLVPTGYASVELRDEKNRVREVFLYHKGKEPNTNGYRCLLPEDLYRHTKKHWDEVLTKAQDPHSYFYTSRDEGPPKPYATWVGYAQDHVDYLEDCYRYSNKLVEQFSRLEDDSKLTEMLNLLPQLAVRLELITSAQGVGHLAPEVPFKYVGDRRRTPRKAGYALCAHAAVIDGHTGHHTRYLCYGCLGRARRLPKRHGLAL